MNSRTEWIVLDDQGARIRASEEYVVLADHWIPRVLELEDLDTAGDPQRYIRVEVGEAGPRLVALHFTSNDPESDGVRQTDLRDVQVSALLEDFVAIFTFRIERSEDGTVVHSSLNSADFIDALRFVGNLRRGRVARTITPKLLKDVADIYRANIDKKPTQSVEHHYQVSQRTAAGYVQEARRRGYLPPTKRGKKNA